MHPRVANEVLHSHIFNQHCFAQVGQNHVDVRGQLLLGPKVGQDHVVGTKGHRPID